MFTQSLICYNFAVIHNDRGDVLMMQRGKRENGTPVWGLPGGGIEDSNVCSAAKYLHSFLNRELGLHLERVTGRISGPLYSLTGECRSWFYIAEAFSCETSGEPQASSEDQRWEWFDASSAIQCAHEDRLVYLTPDAWNGKPHRMTRMLLDAVSIQSEPFISCETGGEAIMKSVFDLPICTDYQIAGDGLYLVKVTEDITTVWKRLDPFTPSGYMEPVQKRSNRRKKRVNA